MMVENLTWQAIGTYAVFFGIGGVAIAWGFAKTVKAWREGVSGFLCLGRLFQGQPNEAALCI